MVAAAFLATAFGYLAVLGSIGGLYYMMRCYRIKARPFWNHWQVGTAFGGSVLSLGAVLAGTVIFVTLALGGASGASVFIVTLVCTALLALGLLIEAVWHIAHARAIGLANMPQVGVALLRH